MPLLKEYDYTIDDIYDLPDGQRAELIDGQIYDMAPPTRRHQGLVMSLATIINNYIWKNGGPCRIYPAPFAVKLSADDRTYVEPDLSVICDPKKLTEKGCTGAPDWILEVVSPSSRRMDYSIKLFKYRTARVREYWILDPERNRITVYNLEGDDVNEYTFTDTVPSVIYPDLSVDFSGISF
ncbi:MAG: Uma2 family endonuclease [Clostridiales bacterium]|nr:Uma2 family endonuclease [Clostridiales bacterium]